MRASFALFIAGLVSCAGKESPRANPPKPPIEAQAPSTDLAGDRDQPAVLFKAGVFHKDVPAWSASDMAALEAARGSVVDSCQARRTADEICARLAPGCAPMPLPHAWSPCHGRGALCDEDYADGEVSRLLAHPPVCFCSCGPEHASARSRDQQLMRSPPP